MHIYFPYKPEIQNDIKVILFFKDNSYDIHTIILAHPNQQFEHGKLIKNWLKANPKLAKLVNIPIKNHEMIYEIANKLSVKGIATFYNASVTPYTYGCITLPKVPDTIQIENILSWKILYEYFQNPLEIIQNDFYNEPCYVPIKNNDDFYQYIKSFCKTKPKNK